MTHQLQPHPASLHQVRRDNLALVPGSMLSYREAWQRAANRLPDGAVLILLPPNNAMQKQALLAVAKILAHEGRQVSVRPAKDFATPLRGAQPSISSRRPKQHAEYHILQKRKIQNRS